MWPFNLFGNRRDGQASGQNADESPSEPIGHVRIDRHHYPVMHLDKTSMTVSGFTGDLVVNQRFHFTFCFELDGDLIEVPTHGVVLDISGDQLEARYYAPQPYYQRLMRRALAGRAA